MAKIQILGQFESATEEKILAVSEQISYEETTVAAELDKLNLDKQDALTFDAEPKEGSTNPVRSNGIYKAFGDVQEALKEKQDKLTFDAVPTNGSPNPVTSSGLYQQFVDVNHAISLKQDQLTFDDKPNLGSTNPVESGGIYNQFVGVWNVLQQKQDTLTFDSRPLPNSSNPVTSSGIYKEFAQVQEEIQGKQDTLTFDDMPTGGSLNPVTSEGIKTALSRYYTSGETDDAISNALTTFTSTVSSMIDDEFEERVATDAEFAEMLQEAMDPSNESTDPERTP